MKILRTAFFTLAVAAVIYYAFLMPHVSSGRGGPITAAHIQIDNIKTQLGAFEVDCGRYPTTHEGLAALYQRPADIPTNRWHGPYAVPDSKFIDPWGKPLVYRGPGFHNTSAYDLSCRDTDLQIDNWHGFATP